MRNAKRDAVTSSLLFFVIGLVATVAMGGRLLDGVASFSFSSTSGVISTSSVSTETSTDSDGDLVTDDVANIRFRYDVGSREYESSGVYLADPTPKTSLFVSASDLVRTYAPGSETTVYHDAADPTRACLRRGFGPGGYALLGFLAAMFGFGAYILLWGTKKKPGLYRLSR